MILYGYAFYNRKVGAYLVPQFEPYDKELKVEMVKRAYVMANDKDRADFDECDFYFLGQFDDKVGSFNLQDKPEYLLRFGNDDGKK